jgi:release factor glutamine methyltransferase
VSGTPPRFSEPVDPPRRGTPWSVLRLLRWSTQYLEGKGIPEVRIDVEHLLAHALGLRRLDLYLHFERPLTEGELAVFKPLLLERAERRPLQYILGRAAFRELNLQVDERVLIPRPETEELVEAVLTRVREWGREGLDAVDIGTGSGAIALSLALEGPFRRVIGTDRSREALEVARENAIRHGLAGRVRFLEGDLYEPLEGGERVDVVVSNPPYVAPQEMKELEPEIREWEPRPALEAGEDGLEVLHRLVEGAPTVLRPGGLLALEIGSGQARPVADRFGAEAGWETPVVLRDLSGRERVVLAARRREEEAAGGARGDTARTERRTGHVEDSGDGRGAGEDAGTDR